MTGNPKHVVVSDRTCGCTAVHTHHVHHRDFPEIHVEGLSTTEAAGQLADRLTSILDSAASDERRQQVLAAIEDVRHFLGHAAAALADRSAVHAAQKATAIATAQAAPHIVVDAGPLGTDLHQARSTPLLKGHQIEVTRLVLRKGKELATHKAKGETTVFCIEGELDFEVGGHTHRLRPGCLVYLDRHEAHAVKALQDSSLLLTIVTG